MSFKSFLDASYAFAHESMVANGATHAEASRQLDRVGRELTEAEMEEDNARAYAADAAMMSGVTVQ